MLLTARHRAATLFFLLSVSLLLFGTGSTSAQLMQLPSSGTSEASSKEEADGSGAGEASLGAASDALIKVLQDPASREALIEQLRKLPAAQQNADANGGQVNPQETGPTDQGQTPDTAGREAAGETGQREDETFAVWLGQQTRVFVDDVKGTLERLGHGLRGFVLLANGDVQVRWERARQAVLEVAVVMISAVAMFLIGQKILGRILQRSVREAPKGGVVRRLALLVSTTSGDILTVVVGWAAGYGAALVEFGNLESGVSLLESLALNAFMVTGLAKVALRLAFAPKRPQLRLLPLKDDTASYWSKRLGFVLSWAGYGLMLGVPVANLTVSFVVGNAVRVVVVLSASAFLLMLVHHNHARVARGIKDYAQRLSSELASRSLKRLADFWHLAAYLYVLVVFGVWISRPFDAVTIIVKATGYSVLAIMGGFLLSFIMTRAITGGVRLPQNLKESLPALEGRLNAFVPRILKIFRLLVFIATVIFLLDIWGVTNFGEWLASPTGSDLIGRYSSAVLVLLVSFGIWLAVMSWVDLRLREQAGYIVTARVRTLFQLFRNAFTVVIIVMAALLALSELGVDIGPLIAGAGVVGLAISFGAQTLVKDIITGAFIQIENAINEGDVVTVGGTTGVVERLTVRSVRLRDLDGTTHIVPFSSVDLVSNFMRDFSYHVALIGVSYDTDIKKAKAAMEEAFNRLKEGEQGQRIIGDLEMHGVTNFGDSAIDIRARIKTTPGDQWATGRAYNEYVKDVFDEWGIEIPFPQVTYHSATPPVAVVPASKSGKAHDTDEDSDTGSSAESNDTPSVDQPNQTDD